MLKTGVVYCKHIECVVYRTITPEEPQNVIKPEAFHIPIVKHEVLWYGDVCMSVRVFPTFFTMNWPIRLVFLLGFFERSFVFIHFIVNNILAENSIFKSIVQLFFIMDGLIWLVLINWCLLKSVYEQNV